MEVKGLGTLDNAPFDYNYNWQHFENFDTKLKSESYDIVFKSWLEHISQFREKSIFEMNRILKIGGTLRILYLT